MNYSPQRASITVAKMAVLVVFGLLLSCDCRLVDLSHAFDNNTYFWSTEQPLTVTVTFNGTRPERGFWYLSEKFCAGTTHSGTHMDAPCHYNRDGWCIDQIPLEHLIVPAVVVDIASEVGDDPNVHLTVDHLLQWENVHGEIPSGSLLLICTGWSRYVLNRQMYLGTTGKDVKLLKFPSITSEAATWITKKRIIVGIGIDSASIGRIDMMQEIHVMFLQQNVYALEHLTNLHFLPPTGARVIALPTKLKNAGGAPVRAVATFSG